MAPSGSESDGFKSHAYELSCNYEQSTSTSNCSDPNLATSWTATAGSNSCNGVLSGETCKRDGIEIKEDADTSFMMDLKNSTFEKTEDWFTTLKVPTFTTLELKINQ